MLVAAFAAGCGGLRHRLGLGRARRGDRGLRRASRLVHGFAAISQRGNQIVSGVAINMLAGGAHRGPRQRLVRPGRAHAAARRALRAPFPGPQRAVLGSLRSPVYVALSGCSAHRLVVLAQTRFGLRLRAVGENPAAVDTAGISVEGLRYAAVLIGGVLCGLGGAYLAVAQSAGFIPNMTAGKGFIALAALIFANWRAWPALGTCCSSACSTRSRSASRAWCCPASARCRCRPIQALPYLMTVILLAGFIGTAHAAPRLRACLM